MHVCVSVCSADYTIATFVRTNALLSVTRQLGKISTLSHFSISTPSLFLSHLIMAHLTQPVVTVVKPKTAEIISNNPFDQRAPVNQTKTNEKRKNRTHYLDTTAVQPPITNEDVCAPLSVCVYIVNKCMMFARTVRCESRGIFYELFVHCFGWR